MNFQNSAAAQRLTIIAASTNSNEHNNIAASIFRPKPVHLRRSPSTRFIRLPYHRVLSIFLARIYKLIVLSYKICVSRRMKHVRVIPRPTVPSAISPWWESIRLPRAAFAPPQLTRNCVGPVPYSLNHYTDINIPGEKPRGPTRSTVVHLAQISRSRGG